MDDLSPREKVTEEFSGHIAVGVRSKGSAVFQHPGKPPYSLATLSGHRHGSALLISLSCSRAQCCQARSYLLQGRIVIGGGGSHCHHNSARFLRGKGCGALVCQT